MSYSLIRSKVVPLPLDDVDTDQIIPARYLKVTDKKGLGDMLFADWRKLPDGSPNPDFPLHRPEHQGGEILLAGSNFGCGSSREHAPWALTGFGFRAVLALSFADIFRNNALKNGLLPVVIPREDHEGLLAAVHANPATEVSVDLESQTVTLPGGKSLPFQVDSFARHCLLTGVDELGYLLSLQSRIDEHEQRSV
jgi:3-isopropylmalate/(R)-2-methylmalate dehydratase small subunit